MAFPFRNFTVDHVVPRSQGGTDHFDNLQLLCGVLQQREGRPPPRGLDCHASRPGHLDMTHKYRQRLARTSRPLARKFRTSLLVCPNMSGKRNCSMCKCVDSFRRWRFPLARAETSRSPVHECLKHHPWQLGHRNAVHPRAGHDAATHRAAHNLPVRHAVNVVSLQTRHDLRHHRLRLG